MSDEPKKESEEPRFKYTIDNPQAPPSPLLAEYMRNNNIDKEMGADAKKWFDELRDALRKKERGTHEGQG